MHRVRSFELGDYDGRTYYLTVAVEPDPDERRQFERYEDADDWCVSIPCPGRLPNASDTEIARIDTAHLRPHFHHPFSRDQPVTWLSGDLSVADAERWLAGKWKAYAEEEDHHGGDRTGEQ